MSELFESLIESIEGLNGRLKGISNTLYKDRVKELEVELLKSAMHAIILKYKDKNIDPSVMAKEAAIIAEETKMKYLTKDTFPYA